VSLGYFSTLVKALTHSLV